MCVLPDPHAGNILVRRHPVTARTQLVLLDHGLYRDLGKEFQVAYARCVSLDAVVAVFGVLRAQLWHGDGVFRLWLGLITGDESAIRYGRLTHQQAAASHTFGLHAHREQSRVLGAGRLYRLLAGIMTTRTWDRVMDPALDSLHVGYLVALLLPLPFLTMPCVAIDPCSRHQCRSMTAS